MKKLLIIWNVLLFVISNLNAQDNALRVGDVAPPLKIFKWIKGSPITSFEKGHTYIIDFGYINCPPCRASIPHLTRLQEKHVGKMSLISVHIYENSKSDTVNTSYVGRVEQFVKKMGDKIGYTVAVDDPKQTMAKTWMEAAKQNSSPTAFVVDKEGRIAWIGNPMKVSPIIDALCKEGLNVDYRQGWESKYQESLAKSSAAFQRSDFKRSMYIIDSLILKNPNQIYLYVNKFSILLKLDEFKAYRYGRHLLEKQCRDSEPLLYSMVQEIVENHAKSKLKAPDWNLAFDMTSRASELAADDYILANILHTQAEIFSTLGNFTDAIKTEKRAINLLNNLIVLDRNNNSITWCQVVFSNKLEEYIRKESKD